METVANEAGLDGLPEEIRQIVELSKQRKKERIESLGKIVSKKRGEAVSARKSSGIEKIWEEDEEYYLGIDDANRASHSYTKAMNASGGLASNTRSDTEGRCTAFFNITRQFVDSASARMGDILLPAGDWNWGIKPTPIPDLDKAKDSAQPVVDPATGQPKLNPDGSPYTLGQFAAEETKDSEEKVKKAETRIRDWLTQCQYHAEVRKVIEDAAKIGTGVLRGAVAKKSKIRAVMEDALVIKEDIVPSSQRIDPRNFFPDPSCGDYIHNGNYVLERDFLSARQLRDLKGVPQFIAENIDKVLEEGACKSSERPGAQTEGKAKDDDRFEVWYYYGNVDIDDLDALGAVSKDDEPGKDEVPAVIVVINDTVIKGYVNPLDTGEFPFDVMPWQRMSDSPWGVGVARQGRVAQDMLNAASRALMENAGLSASPMIGIKFSAIEPADGDWTIRRGKIWWLREDSDVKTISDAIQPILIPSMQQELSAIMQQAYKMMEDATGVSFLLQGQQGSAPDTVGGMELLNKNASALLRRIARTFDECVTEPHIRRYYDWLLMHGEDEEKGDFEIQAIGSTALVEREIQSQQAAQILQMALNPAFGYSPKKAADELLRAWRFEPSKFELTEEEKKQAEEQAKAQAQQPAPQIQAAQIRAQTDKEIAQMRNQAELQKVKVDMDRDTVFAQSVSRRDQMTYESRMAELQMKRELAMMEYASKHNITLEQIKAKLASDAMKLRTTKELAAAQLSADRQPITPPIEPPGRARPGHSFTE